jgi:hypothetical protein
MLKFTSSPMEGVESVTLKAQAKFETGGMGYTVAVNWQEAEFSALSEIE